MCSLIAGSATGNVTAFSLLAKPLCHTYSGNAKRHTLLCLPGAQSRGKPACFGAFKEAGTQEYELLADVQVCFKVFETHG